MTRVIGKRITRLCDLVPAAQPAVPRVYDLTLLNAHQRLRYDELGQHVGLVGIEGLSEDDFTEIIAMVSILAEGAIL